MGRYFNLKPLNAKKFPESAWKTLFYGATWTYSAYLLIYSGKYDYFYRPNHIWEGKVTPGKLVYNNNSFIIIIEQE